MKSLVLGATIAVYLLVGSFLTPTHAWGFGVATQISTPARRGLVSSGATPLWATFENDGVEWQTYARNNEDKLLEEAKKLEDTQLTEFLKKVCPQDSSSITVEDACEMLRDEEGERSDVADTENKASEEQQLPDPAGRENANLDGLAFARLVIENAALVNLADIRITIEGEGERGGILFGKKYQDADSMLKALNDEWEGHSIVSINVSWEGFDCPRFEPPFRLQDVTSIFQKDLAALEDFLDSTVVPLRIDENNMDLPQALKPNLEFVQCDPPNAKNYFYNAAANDKSFAVVVAGESGSGKSVFSCLQARDCGYSIFYAVLKDLSKKPESECTISLKPPNEQFPAVKELYQKMIFEREVQLKAEADASEADTGEGNTKLDHMYARKKKVNLSRNKWARKVFDETLLRVVKEREDPALEKWFKGQWPAKDRPKRVAIVFDEATVVDLVEGLVDQVREIKNEYFTKLAERELIIVLSGTGLDAIRDEGRVGTNPAYSRLVTLLSPDLSNPGITEPDIREGILRGTLSRVMRTNTRMLFRAVLPIMTMRIHEYEPAKGGGMISYADRLAQIGSFLELMDYAPRMYVGSNSIASLEVGERSLLLKQAFVFHMRTAVEHCLKENTKRSPHLEAILLKELKVIDDFEVAAVKSLREEIFTKGLASRTGTSLALKYLACFGLTCQLRTGFGDEFEELTALHYMRRMQVQGFTTRRCVLKYAWPPKAVRRSSGTESQKLVERSDVEQAEKEAKEKAEEDELRIEESQEKSVEEPTVEQAKKKAKKTAEEIQEEDKLRIQVLKGKLAEQARDELEDFDFSGMQGKKTKECVVFSQGAPTAQGGDVLALVWDGNDVFLDVIQCKHEADSKGPKEATKWWCSLGVSPKVFGDTSDLKIIYSAEHSLTGLEAFRNLLQEKLGKRVSLRQRILAVSFKTPETAVFPVPEGENFHVWFREMMEPTISVVPPRPLEEPQFAIVQR